MKLIGAAGIAMMCAASLGAQSSTRTATTKAEAKDGETVKVVGCLAPSSDGRYLLTGDSGRVKYFLLTDRDLSKDTGKLVEVKGGAADLTDR